MTAGPTISLQLARVGPAPVGWEGFVAEQRLPAFWSWPLVNLAATVHRAAVFAGTVVDGGRVRGILTARFVGPRLRRAAVPLAGVFDVDCLLSGSMPGIVLEAGLDPAARAELLTATLAGLRTAVRKWYGRRVAGVMLRQVGAGDLPTVLRWPAVVREGGPIAVFHNTFADVDAYLASLPRTRRQSLLRAERTLVADPDVIVTSTLRGDAVKPQAADVRALHRRTVDRNHRRWYLRRRVVDLEMAQAQLSHPEVEWIAYHSPAGTLLGFCSLWQHPKMPQASLAGSLYPDPGGRKDLWFHWSLQLIRWCIDSGRSGIISGQGAIEVKRTLGYTPQRQWAVLVPQPLSGR